MNEQRLKAYLNLIDALLSYPSEALEILNANQHLIDTGLVQVMQQAAAMMEEMGDRNSAEFLNEIARQLAEALELSSSTLTSSSLPNTDSQLDFLLDVLRAIYDSKGEPKVVHPLFQENLEKLDDKFAQVLRSWATDILPEQEPKVAQHIAAAIAIFSVRILEFRLGNRVNNLEIAITGYELAATIFNHEAFPQDWARLQNNLGNAYRERFLKQVLQAMAESKGNPEVVYPLLQVNLDKLDDNFATILQNWATAILSSEELEKAQCIAAVIGHFSILISEFPLGNRVSNLEIAITGNEIAATVFTRKTFPETWAEIQNNLGEVYRNRICGEKAENLEKAIHCLQDALEIRTREAFPQDWADTQNNLGAAYIERIQGEKAENLEKAISYFKAALDVFKREAFPQKWAMTQMNLSTTYLKRIQGKRAENLEEAIYHFNSALKVLNRQDSPEKWAILQNNMGEAYRNRCWGERAENLEKAILCFKAALQVVTRENLPEQWANIQNNLGNNYLNRIRGERAENLEAAISYFKAALDVFKREVFPQKYAATKNNLGNAYSKRIQGEREENWELAISCYLDALEVRTRRTFPVEWADTQNNLGIAYSKRIQGEREENLEQAIRCYLDALEVDTQEAFPQEWAMTQMNLGTAYAQRIQGQRAENWQLAIGCCLSAALEIRTHEALRQEYAMIQLNLGRAYQETQQFSNAYTAFAAAIDAVESLRSEIVSGSGREEDKQKLAEEWNHLYQRMVEVCLELGYLDQAIEYVERSKTRNLVELILSRDLRSIFPLEIVSQLQQLQDEIASAQYRLQTATADDPAALVRHLQQLRQQRNELQDRYLPIGSSFKFDQFRATLDEQTAIIEWYITSGGLQAFIFTRHSSQPLVLSTTVDDLNAFRDWGNAYLKDYYRQNQEWRKQLSTRLEQLAKILHLDEILAQLPPKCDQLVLMPYLFLHLFPLHALPVTRECCLLDRFKRGVRYAPSCQLLRLAETRQRPNFTHLFAIQNPTEDLTYTDIEVEFIKGYFHPIDIVKKATATKAAIDKACLSAVHCAHFSCHGYFNPAKPRKSALILADAYLSSAPAEPDAERYLPLIDGRVLDLYKCLTLDTIFTLNLEQCRLVTLSACETGLIDFRNISNEYIGLPSGFLYAGSPSVVSSLWAVSDLSTFFLMSKFYENLTELPSLEKGDVAIALNQAQKWLRDLTSKEFEELLDEYKPHIEQTLAQLGEDECAVAEEYLLQVRNRKPHPFSNPYYWAGFTATGL